MSNSSHDPIYLQHLKFDEKLRHSFLAKYLANTRLTILIILSLLIAGTFSFLRLPRQLNPDVDLAIVNVVTVLPGASPLDVENLVTKKIEKELKDVSNVDTITSSSSNSVSVITIQFLGDTDSDKALEDVRQKVDLVSDLPTNTEKPTVQKLDFNDQPVWQVALTGDTDVLSLTRLANKLKDSLEQTPGLRKVSLSGQEDEEIVIELDKKALTENGLSSGQIAQMIRSNDLSFPAGSVTVDNTEYTVTLDSQLKTVEQVRELQLNTGRNTIPLGQVANVYLKSKDAQTRTSILKDGKRSPAVMLSIFKAKSEGIDSAFQKANKILDEQLKQYLNIRAMDVVNAAEKTTTQFGDLQNSFVTSIMLVLISLTIFLGFRQAVIAAISLPLTLMSAFTIMGIYGVALSFLSVFSLLLAISLIGDDAIVIVQSSKLYQRKFPPFEAGLLVWRDYFLATWTGTISVVWSFVPLLLASGIIGKFIRPIPIVVSATLLSSTTISVLINLPLNIVFAKLQLPTRVRVLLGILATLFTTILLLAVVNRSPLAIVAFILYILLLVLAYFNRANLSDGLRKFPTRFSTRFPRVAKPFQWFHSKNFLGRSFIDVTPVATFYISRMEPFIAHKRNRLIIYAGLVGAIIVSIVLMATGILKNEFFPKSNENMVFVNVEGPAGWTKTNTNQVMTLVEEQLKTVPEVRYSLEDLGASAGGGFGGGAGGGNNTGSFTVILKDKADRKRTSSDIAESLRNTLKQFPEAKITVSEESGGPPAGADFQANIKGDDLDTLEKISHDFQSKLKEIKGVTNVDSSLKLSPGEIHVDLIPAELAKRNLSAGQVGDWLRTAVSGQKTSSIVINTLDTDVVITLDKTDQNLSYLQNLALPSQLGQYTLGDIAHLRLEQSPTSIARKDGKRLVSVTGSAEGGQTAPEILKAFNEKMKSYDMPAGYTWDVGGANDENQKSVNSILQAMIISFVLILITIVLLLGSFRQAFMILAAIPVAIAGVFIAFTIFGIPLSFPALIGILALFGIVVNNAIMMMHKINQNVALGFPLYKGVVDAAGSRIEPIFLTAVTGISGLLPITLSDPLWQGLGGAIVAGLSLSGIIILFLIPTLYVEVFGKEILKKQQLALKK